MHAGHLVAALALAAACGGPRPVAPPPPTPEAAPLDAAAPDAAPVGLTAADVAADLATLRTTLDALHPGLHRYLTPAELDAAFADAAAEATAAPTTATVVLALARLTARLRCGHTFVNPSNQSDEVRAAVMSAPRVPFAFRWIGEELVVTRSLDPRAALTPGTIIERIDGVAAADLRARLLPLGRADGGNQAKRLASLEVHADAAIEAFDVYAPLVAPELAPPYALELRSPDGARSQLTVEAMTAEARAALAAEVEPDASDDGPQWQLRWLDARTGYLPMASWVTYHRKRDWAADVDAIMAEVAARPKARLIVDLRGNEGGTDVGARILAHVVTRPVPARDRERWVRYRSVPEALRAPLDTWDRSFFDWGADAVASDDPAWFRLADEPGADTIAPATPRFRGKLIVLVDASNSSATFQFAHQVQTLGAGTLVGEPTGGNQRGLNGGAFFFMHLPRTGVEVDLPLIGSYPPGRRVDGVPDGGVTPDRVVITTAADLAAGRDPQLAVARALR